MVAFEVFLNNQKICTCGVGLDGVVDATVAWMAGTESRPEEFFFNVGGVNPQSHERLRWNVPPLSVGDEVTIRIVEVDKVDEPTSRDPMPSQRTRE